MLKVFILIIILCFLLVLYLFRRSVNDEKGLKYIYMLIRDRLTKEQFYKLCRLFLNSTTYLITFAFVLTFAHEPLCMFVEDYIRRRSNGKEVSSQHQLTQKELRRLAKSDGTTLIL